MQITGLQGVEKSGHVDGSKVLFHVKHTESGAVGQ